MVIALIDQFLQISRLMEVNLKMSKIVHVHNSQKPRTQLALKCYNYLGFILNKHLSEKNTVEALTSATRRSFGSAFIVHSS